MAKIKRRKIRLVRQTRRWLREEHAAWSAITGEALLEEWMPDFGYTHSSGIPLPGGGDGEPQPGGDDDVGEGEHGPEQADAEEKGGDGGPDEGDDGDDAPGGDEGDGGDEQSGGGEPEPEVVKVPRLERRPTTDSPAASDVGCVFSHRAQRNENNTTNYRREFSSVQDFIKQPFANPANRDLFVKEQLEGGTQWRSWGGGKPLRSGMLKTNRDWYGAATGEEAADRAIQGWPEGAERVRQLLADVEVPEPVNIRRKLRRGDQGDELDIHAVYRGALDRAWTRRQRTHHRSRMTVRLALQLGGSKMMSQEEMFWRGAAVAKLTEALEDAGYGVELMCAESTQQGWRGDELHQLFCLKDAGTPLNLEQVAGVVCNAGFFRTWCFRGMYAITEATLVHSTSETIVGESYVNHVNLLEDPEYRLGDDGTPTFVVPFNVDNHATAKQFIDQVLAAVAAGLQEAA